MPGVSTSFQMFG